MTALATDVLPAARRRVRVRLTATIVAGLVVVAALLVYGVQYRRAGDRLDHHRDALAAAQFDLAAERHALEQARGATAAADLAVDAVRLDISQAVAARAWLEGLTANTLAAIAGTRAELRETDTARFLVAAHANEAHACFAGVAGAVNSSRAGDDRGAANAMRGASDACTRTLAYATGARFPYDFPDPFVLRAGGTYYGYATNSGAGDIQVIRSADLVNWELVGNALPRLPRWARAGTTWAPAVLERGGRYVAYYTVRDAASDRQCISRAISASPSGPFVDDTSGPLTCGFTGAIDPSPFVDADGTAYLLWKSEAFSGGPTALWSQQLTGDGAGLRGTANLLLGPDRAFERGVVEAPSMVREGNTYFLVYSGANWTSSSYAVGYATCRGPAGPCTKPSDNRILTSGARLAGPGGAEVFRDGNGALFAAYHAYSQPNVGYPNNRYLYVAPVRVVNGRLVIDAST